MFRGATCTFCTGLQNTKLKLMATSHVILLLQEMFSPWKPSREWHAFNLSLHGAYQINACYGSFLLNLSKISSFFYLPFPPSPTLLKLLDA